VGSVAQPDRAALSEGGAEGRPSADAVGDDAAGLFPAELVCVERPDGGRFKREAIDPVDRL